MNIGIIYRAKNKINGKYYVGQTWSGLSIRKSKHYQSSQCPYFSNALKKYNKDDFEWEILCEAKCQEELDRLEKYYIKKYNSTNRGKGYNITKGGRGSGPMNKKTRIKLSRSHGGMGFFGKNIYKNDTVFFNTHSEAANYTNCHKQNITRALQNKGYTINGWNFSYSREECINTTPKTRRKFWAFKDDTVLEFTTQNEASEFLKCSISNINSVLVGRTKLANGWKISYNENESNIPKSKIFIAKNEDKNIKFNSRKEISNYLKCSRSAVDRHLQGRSKTVLGFTITEKRI